MGKISKTQTTDSKLSQITARSATDHAAVPVANFKFRFSIISNYL